MKSTQIYINQYGVKTTKKLDRIILAAQNHTRRNFNGNKMFCDFLETKRMMDLRNRFEVEVERIGGLPYNFGDCMA